MLLNLVIEKEWLIVATFKFIWKILCVMAALAATVAATAIAPEKEEDGSLLTGRAEEMEVAESKILLILKHLLFG